MGDREIEFSWNGRRLSGRQGDSLSSALWRNGIRSVAASRKRHLPLGLNSSYMSGQLARVDGVPNIRLDVTPLANGTRISAQNCWPATGLDLLRLARMIPPRLLYGGFEQSSIIRNESGLYLAWERLMAFLAGVADAPDFIDDACPPGKRISVDVLVVGAGPRGVNAANAAANLGKRVALASRSSGQGRFARACGQEMPPLDERVAFHGDADVFGVYRSGRLVVAAPHDGSRGAIIFDAGELVLATGTTSIPPLVPGSCLGGVMDLRTALSLMEDFGTSLGQRMAVIGDGDEMGAAARLTALGGKVVAVEDRSDVSRIRGSGRVTGLVARTVIDCDAVIHVGRWRANDSLAFQAGATGLLQLQPGGLPANVTRLDEAKKISAGHSRGYHRKALVCPCMDVTVGEIIWRIEQGHCDLEVLKRLTSCGMGPCQGFPCWEHLADLVEHLVPDAPQVVRRPSLRPPRRAITVGQAAGLHGLVEPDRW